MKVVTKFFQKNAFIYLEGKNNLQQFFIIKSGQVKIRRKNPILGEVEDIKTTGFIFGIIQAITGIADDEVVQAYTDVELFVIHRSQIDDLYKEHSKVIFKILSEYSEILRNLDKELIKDDLLSGFVSRKDRVIEIADIYLRLKQEAKAAHILKSAAVECKENSELCERINHKLQGLPVVNVLSPKQLISEIRLPPNSIIFTEYEMADCFYIIKKGKVKISKIHHEKEVLLAVLGDGDIFGEMAILNNKPRNATAVVVEDEAILMMIDKKGINNLPPGMFLKILELLTKRIWFVQQQLICYRIPVPTAKIYYLLTSKIKLSIPDPRREYDRPFRLNFPIEEVYEMLNFDESMKNDLSDLLQDRNIQLLKDSIKIRNIGDLFDKNSYNFSRALYMYHGIMGKKI